MRKIWGIILIASLFGCGLSDGSGGSIRKDKPVVYYNGDILTMEGDSANYVEALVVADGKIAFTGTYEAALQNAGAPHETVDLKGKTLLPGFIDAHGHAWNAGFQKVAANLLPSPDGNCNSIDDLQKKLKEWAAASAATVSRYGWIIGFGYDDAQLKEKEHPTADDLDKVSVTVPVIVIHQSGHLATMNHKALQLAGYTAGSVDPPGGIIRRVEGSSEPNGVLEEMALFGALFKLFARLDEEANEKIALAGIEAYTRFGYTTLQEGRASADITETWRKLATEGRIPVDIACFPDVQSSQSYMLQKGVSKVYEKHFRIAGVKLSLDGSPQGRTAWLSQPYKVPPEGQASSYSGYPAFNEEAEVDSLVQLSFSKGWQVLAHANGDAACGQFIRCVDRAIARFGKADRRPVMIHAQTVSDSQLDSMKLLGIIPSFFSMHTYYWGDWHRDVTLGKERAYRISPTASALGKGILFTEHHDAPVALPSSLMILHTTVNRVSRSGDIIGPDERISPYHALCSITKWAAYQYFEEGSKGTLTPGKMADMVVLNQNPLKVDSMALKDIVVERTIKEGKVIYKTN